MDYYSMRTKCAERMLLYSLLEDDDHRWLDGAPFADPPAKPIRVEIQEGYETGVLVPWFGVPPVMSVGLIDALRGAGIDNIEAYPVELIGQGGVRFSDGLRIVNVVGVVSMASAETKVLADYPSRLIDAHITDMKPAPDRAQGLELFRLAEAVHLLIVSERIKAKVERAKIEHLVFDPLADVVT